MHLLYNFDERLMPMTREKKRDQNYVTTHTNDATELEVECKFKLL